ncbi:MAG: hypothetical protein Q8K78_06330 [Planctomycetaceae bacterium]|nr:hypothetical protein [Planctomycetaceae bacterium]
MIFGVIALGITGLVLLRCYQTLLWWMTESPRAEEFDEAVTLREKVQLTFEVGQLQITRTVIIIVLMLGIPLVSLMFQKIRQFRGAPQLSRRRVYWESALATWGLIIDYALLGFVQKGYHP